MDGKLKVGKNVVWDGRLEGKSQMTEMGTQNNEILIGNPLKRKHDII